MLRNHDSNSFSHRIGRVASRHTALLLGAAVTTALGCGLSAANAANAANTLAWDPGMTPAGTVAAPTGSAGNGTWDLSATNTVWSAGTSDVAWTNTDTVAQFYGTGTVTVGAAITAHAIFLGDDITAATYTLDLNGNSVSPTATSEIQAGSTLTLEDLSGSGTGTLNNSGNFDLGHFTEPGNATLNIDTGATFNNIKSLTAANRSGGVVNLNGGTLSGTGVIYGYHSSAGDDYNSTFNLNSGNLDLSQSLSADRTTSTSVGKAVVNFNGATVATATGFSGDLVVAGTAGAVAANYTLNVGNGGAIIDTTAADMTIAEALNHTGTTDGGLTKQGTGTLTLSGTNTYNGGTTVTAGTLADTSLTTGVGTGDVTVAADSSAGAIFQMNAATDLLATQSLVLTDYTGSANTALVNLNYTGADTIMGLTDDGTALADGLYSSTSGSFNGSPVIGESYLTGGGILQIGAVPEPSEAMLIGLLAVPMLMKRRRNVAL